MNRKIFGYIGVAVIGIGIYSDGIKQHIAQHNRISITSYIGHGFHYYSNRKIVSECKKNK